MNREHEDIPGVQFILFGASGDLSARLILPALYNLFLGGNLPEKFQLIGVDRQDSSDDVLGEHYHDAVSRYSRNGIVDKSKWQAFTEHLHYYRADLKDEAAYKKISALLS